MLMSQVFELEQGYSAGFHVPENYAFKAEKGLNEKIVAQISEMKGEPAWMRDFRLKSLKLFEKRPMPTWGADLSGINFDDIYYISSRCRSRARRGKMSPLRSRRPLIAWASRRPNANTWPA